MDNQHRKITGYRELSEEEIWQMNQAKRIERELLDFIEDISITYGSDGRAPNPRWLSIAKTDFERGFMALVRSIAKPNGE